MRDIAALLFLQWRQIVNRAKLVFSSPARAVLYVLLTVYFVGTGIARGTRIQHIHHIAEPFASAIFFAFLTLLAVVAYGAAGGAAGVFSSPADARFLAGSRMNERLVVFWLQLRRSASALLRTIFSLLLYFVLVTHSAETLGLTLGILGAALIISAVPIPLLKLRATLGPRVSKSAAGALAAIAILPLLILLSGLGHENPSSSGIERLGAGAYVNAVFISSAPALAALWAAATLLIALAWASAAGLYPELYAASQKAFAFRRRARGGASIAFTGRQRFENRRADGVIGRAFDRLRGSWCMAWKEWLAFSRSPGMQRLFVFGLCVAGAAGAGVGTYAYTSKDPLGISLAFFPTAFFVFVMFVAMGSAITLRSDIGKPLWWSGRDSLRTRLLAWTLSTSWRTALIVFAAIGGWALGMHRPDWAIYALPGAAAMVSYMRATGLAIYAIFPSTIDQRGPMGAIRALLTYLFGAPPLIAGAVASFAFHVPAIAVVTIAIAVAAIEVYALVAFSARRIAGRGFAFAGAEVA